MINKTKVQTGAAIAATVAAQELVRHDWIRVVSPSGAVYLASLFARNFCAGMLGYLSFMVAWDLFSRWRNRHAGDVSAAGQDTNPHQRPEHNI
jgi:hypothetical protein